MLDYEHIALNNEKIFIPHHRYIQTKYLPCGVSMQRNDHCSTNVPKES
jgi:hypothetical protein